MPKEIKYLTLQEVEQIYFKFQSYKTFVGLRNALLTWISFHHGLRADEAISLTWDKFSIDDEGIFKSLYCVRSKGSNSCIHSTDLRENHDLQKLKSLITKRNLYASNGYIFLSDSATSPFDKLHTNTWRYSLKDIACELWGQTKGKTVTPHTLKHGCGFYLASQGKETTIIQQWLGHKDIKSTLIYVSANTQKIQTQDFI